MVIHLRSLCHEVSLIRFPRFGSCVDRAQAIACPLRGILCAVLDTEHVVPVGKWSGARTVRMVVVLSRSAKVSFPHAKGLTAADIHRYKGVLVAKDTNLLFPREKGGRMSHV